MADLNPFCQEELYSDVSKEECRTRIRLEETFRDNGNDRRNDSGGFG